MAVLLSYMKMMVSGLMSKSTNKAFFITESGEVLPVQFNPEQLQISRSAEYNMTQTKENEQAYLEFSGVINPVMSISFFFDTTGKIPSDSGGLSLQKLASLVGLGGGTTEEEKDVTMYTSAFEGLMSINAEQHRPSFVIFVWGSITFLGFVKSTITTYTMFAKNGMPLRAKIDAVLIGIGDSDSARIPLESPDRTKSRIVSDDKTIWNMAATEYDDAGKWRTIAKENGIMDPFDIPSGKVLKVPALIE